MLAVNRRYIGQLESPPYSNNHPTVTWYRQNIEDIGKYWPYCVAGNTRAFENSPAKGLFKPRAYVPWSIGDFLGGYKGGRLVWIESAEDFKRHAQPGRVIFFDWERNRKRNPYHSDHTGVLETGVRSDGTAVTIEHNTTVPGANNEGTTRRVRDWQYVSAIGIPAYEDVEPPTIPGTNLLALEVDGSWGPKTSTAVTTIMRARGFQVRVSTGINADLIRAVQTDLNRAGHRDKDGRKLKVDGMGIGSNSGRRYPRNGWTRTITAMQIGHGVSRKAADGYFDANESAEVKRIQRDVNIGGTKDSPFYRG